MKKILFIKLILILILINIWGNEKKDPELDKMLVSAVLDGNIEEIKKYIEKGADVNAKDKDGWTALMCACENGNLEFVKYLIEKGADVNLKDYNKGTALD